MFSRVTTGLPRRWRRLALSAAALALGAMPLSASARALGKTDATAPPPVTVLTQGADNQNGDIFITPTGDSSTYANGPEIINNQGQVVWFHPIPQGVTANDFRTQTYQGQPVLTWWQGRGLSGLSNGTDYIYNDHYQQIATVHAGNGCRTDRHEFLITPWDTALILCYATATADLTSIGGPVNQIVVDGIVQEVDIQSGHVLFQWNSADHVPYSASEEQLPRSHRSPWDWFHINTVHLDAQGNLLIGARNTWATYDVNRATGGINWILGGKDSTFTEQAAPGQTLDRAGEIFAWQHDPEALGNNLYTFFDDESAGKPLLPYSRAVYVTLNLQSNVATLVQSDNQPEGEAASADGNAQTALNGDLFVGWGKLPYLSEFSPSGQLLWNAEFPAGVHTYRAYRLPWPPAPPRHH